MHLSVMNEIMLFRNRVVDGILQIDSPGIYRGILFRDGVPCIVEPNWLRSTSDILSTV